MSIIDCSKNKAKYDFVVKVDGEVVDDFDGLCTGPSLERLGMRTPRVVNVVWVGQAQTVVSVWHRPEHEWGTFVCALHYYASRKCGVPIWCVRLRWSHDPWNEALLPMSVTIQFSVVWQ